MLVERVNDYAYKLELTIEERFMLRDICIDEAETSVETLARIVRTSLEKSHVR